VFTDDLETETGGGRVTEVATVSWPVRAFGGVRALVPGISW
jgi:hypothetical protein